MTPSSPSCALYRAFSHATNATVQCCAAVALTHFLFSKPILHWLCLYVGLYRRLATSCHCPFGFLGFLISFCLTSTYPSSLCLSHHRIGLISFKSNSTTLSDIHLAGFNAEERSNFKNILIQNLLLGAKTLAAIAEESSSELLTDKKLVKVRAFG